LAAAYVTRDYWMRQSPGPSLPTALRLRVTDRQGQLEVRWDAALPFVRDAQGGTLEFLEGSTRRFVILDPRFLRAGSVSYARQSDTVRIQMTVEKADGSKMEELVSFLGQAPPGYPAAEPEEARKKVDEAAKEAERVRAESEKQALQKREAERALEQKRLAQRRGEEAARLAAQKKAPPVPSVPPKPVSVAAGGQRPPAPSSTPPAVAEKQVAAMVKPASPAARPEIPASQPAPQVQPPAPQALPTTPPASQPPPAESKPVPPVRQPVPQAPPTTPPASQPPPAESEPVPLTKSEPAAVKPAAAAVAPISGEWTLTRSQPSGSPFRPESVTLSISEEGNWVRGTLLGRYRAPKSSGLRPDVSFSFGGPLRSGTMKFPWGAGDGTKGEIEILRVPNSSDSLEIVWYGADRKFVFNDILVRARKR
jgi:ribosomal protein L12E/L44/L45/RPP1/RPP2